MIIKTADVIYVRNARRARGFARLSCTVFAGELPTVRVAVIKSFSGRIQMNNNNTHL